MKNLFFVICLTALLSVNNSKLFAVLKVSNVTTGDWQDPNTWLPVGVPFATDDVTIKTGHTVNLIAALNYNRAATGITYIIESGAVLNLNGFNIALNSSIFGSEANGSFTFICDGTINGGIPMPIFEITTGVGGGVANSGNGSIKVRGIGTITSLSTLRIFSEQAAIEIGEFTNDACGNPSPIGTATQTNLAVFGNVEISKFINAGKLTINGSVVNRGWNLDPGFTNYTGAELIVNNGNVTIESISYVDIINGGKIILNNGNLYLKGSGYNYVTNGLITATFPDCFIAFSYTISPGLITVNGDILGNGVPQTQIYNLTNSVINITGALLPTGTADDGEIDAAGASGYAYFDNVVNYNGSGNQVVKLPSAFGGVLPSAYYYLQSSTSGVKSLESNTEIRGNLTIQDAAQLDVTTSTYSINLYGNWINTSSNLNPFVEQTATVVMNGINSQTVSIVNTNSSETFYNLVLKKDSTNLTPYYSSFPSSINKDTAIHLQSNITVTNQLNLIKGCLYLNTHTLTINNPATTAITRTYGYIKSETVPLTGYSFVDWKIGNSVGNYQFPFGKSGYQDYIPVTFNITSSGDALGSLSVATYNTAISNLPLPTGVTNVNRNGIDNSAYTADRFWIINSSYTIAPTLTFTLTATATELGSITNPQAQRWNYSTNLWEFPLPSQTYSITATSVSVSVPNFSMISSPWTIADNNHLLSAKPLVTHSPNVTICTGASTQLTANGINAVYYSWSPIASLTTLSLTPVTTPTLASTFYHFGNDFGIAKVIATPTITTTYTLIISNNSGLDTSYITVTVPEPIVVIIQTPNTSICSGETYQILSKTTISTPAHYSWSPTTSLNNATVFSPIASPQTTTHYTLTITDDWGCYNTDSRLIHVEVQPTLVVSAPITICNGTSTILSAQVIGGTLQWIDGSTTNSILVQPTLTNQYSAFAQNSYCGAKQLIEVTVIDLPIVSAGTDQLMCVGAITGAILSGSSNSGSSYAWTPNNYLNNTIGSSTNASPPSIGIYNYTLTVTESHGCSNYDGVIVRVDTILIVNAGNDLTICSGIATSLNATITAGSTITWNPTTKLIFNPLTPNSPTLNFPTQQLINYSITVSAPGCNDETDYLTVQVLQSPQLVTNNVSICIGMIPTLTVSGADHYSWQPTEDTATVIFPQLVTTTNYTLIGTNNNGCMDTSIININVNNLPNLDAGNNITASTSLKLNLQGSGASVYLWSPSISLDNKDISNPLITNRITQKYNLIGTDNNGCINTDSVYIKYITCDQIFVPDAFSPNGDNSNEMLEIIVEDSQCIQTLNLQIYDRWGNKVFETNDPTVKWNGTYHNQELTDAVFVYRIDITNVDSKNITQKGNLSLIR